ncbi:Ger(x)C family spore germination protein [Paenibacillus abyssi]|uniref:Germination protein GerLC n=1 Tax=Paenibacillus abyssi TaxID=1340531 RepID=A0A917CVY7_9BACL|nr:Ger(x)C family spore germination protein [Paenibacillus abyssi]GGF99483.1 germination protein GerLC [Paenibacillus abyssi]
MVRPWFKGIACLMASTMLLTGCWDRVEIEERGFVLSVAVDEAAEKEGSADEPKGLQQFEVTYQFIIPTGLMKNGKSGSSDGSSAYFNITKTGDSMFGIARSLAAEVSRAPFFEHLKLIVISESAAETLGFANVLDFFIRDHEMRRSVRTVVSKGQAKQMLSVVASNEVIPAEYISSILENSRKNAEIVKKARIGDVHEYLLQKQSFVLPQISKINDKEADLRGSAMFNGTDNKLVGFLSAEETKGLNFLHDKIEGGSVKIKWNDNVSNFEIRESKTTLHADVKDRNRIKFHYHIKTEGIIAELFDRPDLMSAPVIKEMEKLIEEEIRRTAEKTIHKVQRQKKVDVLLLRSHLEKNHYRMFQAIEPDWETGINYFAKSDIIVSVHANIRAIGAINKSERP